MTETDDYELMDKDFDEFIRRGLEEMEWERTHMTRIKGSNTARSSSRQ